MPSINSSHGQSPLIPGASKTEKALTLLNADKLKGPDVDRGWREASGSPEGLHDPLNMAEWQTSSCPGCHSC